MSAVPAILIDNLCKRYRRWPWDKLGRGGVRQVSLRIGQGEAWLLAGPNGAGKSTTLHCMLGLLRPDSGQVQVLGGPPRAARASIGYQAEIFATSPALSAVQVLHFFGRLAGVPSAALARASDRLLQHMGLWQVRHDKVGTYSKGMLQRLGLAQSLVAGPKVVIWDEPTSGLDPAARRLVLDIATALKAAGVTLVICTHVLADMLPLCDHVAIFAQGQLAAAGPIAALLAASRHDSLEDFYLATTAAAAANPNAAPRPSGTDHG